MTFKELRIQSNKSIEKIAKELDVKPQTVVKYEHSIRTPSGSILARMAKVYNTETNKVLEAYEYHKKEALIKYGKLNP